MGQGAMSKLRPWRKKDPSLLLIGLDFSSSTKMWPEEIGFMYPTIRAANDKLDFKMNPNYCFYDYGGRGPLRVLLPHYYSKADVVCVVVDSTHTDESCVERAKDEFQRLIEQEALQGKPLAVLADKQHLPGARTVEQVAQALGVDLVKPNGPTVEVFPTTETTEQGVLNAMKWIQHRLTLGQLHEAVVKPVEKSMCLSGLPVVLKKALTTTKQKLHLSSAA